MCIIINAFHMGTGVQIQVIMPAASVLSDLACQPPICHFVADRAYPETTLCS